MLSQNSLDQLRNMRELLHQGRDREVVKSELDLISQQGVTSSVAAHRNDIFAYFGFPPFDDCHEYQIREVYGRLSKPEIFDLILRNIEIALGGVDAEPVYIIVTTHLVLDKIKVRVRKVLDGDWGEILYQSLDDPEKFFGRYVLGGLALYEKVVELPISRNVFDPEDVVFLRNELKKYKPTR